MSIVQYEIIDGWFNIEMKDLAIGWLKDMPPAIQPKPYEFDESKLIELDPIDDAMLEETEDIVKILNDLF